MYFLYSMIMGYLFSLIIPQGIFKNTNIPDSWVKLGAMILFLVLFSCLILYYWTWANLLDFYLNQDKLLCIIPIYKDLLFCQSVGHPHMGYLLWCPLTWFIVPLIASLSFLKIHFRDRLLDRILIILFPVFYLAAVCKNPYSGHISCYRADGTVMWYDKPKKEKKAKKTKEKVAPAKPVDPVVQPAKPVKPAAAQVKPAAERSLSRAERNLANPPKNIAEQKQKEDLAAMQAIANKAVASNAPDQNSPTSAKKPASLESFFNLPVAPEVKEVPQEKPVNKTNTAPVNTKAQNKNDAKDSVHNKVNRPNISGNKVAPPLNVERIEKELHKKDEHQKANEQLQILKKRGNNRVWNDELISEVYTPEELEVLKNKIIQDRDKDLIIISKRWDEFPLAAREFIVKYNQDFNLDDVIHRTAIRNVVQNISTYADDKNGFEFTFEERMLYWRDYDGTLGFITRMATLRAENKTDPRMRDYLNYNDPIKKDPFNYNPDSKKYKNGNDPYIHRKTYGSIYEKISYYPPCVRYTKKEYDKYVIAQKEKEERQIQAEKEKQRLAAENKKG